MRNPRTAWCMICGSVNDGDGDCVVDCDHTHAEQRRPFWHDRVSCPEGIPRLFSYLMHGWYKRTKCRREGAHTPPDAYICTSCGQILRTMPY